MDQYLYEKLPTIDTSLKYFKHYLSQVYLIIYLIWNKESINIYSTLYVNIISHI